MSTATSMQVAQPNARLLLVSSIRLDGQTQHRTTKDDALVAEYSALMQSGVVFPAVRVWWDGEAFWLADGFHRVAAAERLHVTHIMADVHSGSLIDARWDSYGVNSAHGLRRTPAETRRVVSLAMTHPKAGTLSNVELARHLHIPEATLRRWRKQVFDADLEAGIRTVKRGSTTYSIRTENIGRNGGRPRSKSREDLRVELHRMKEQGDPKARRLLNIIGNWMCNGGSPEECLKAIQLFLS